MDNELRQSRQRMGFLLRVVLLVFGGQIVILSVVRSLYKYKLGTSLFKKFCRGYDFGTLYHAAQFWLAGRDPYKVFGFVTPPPSLIIPSLLAHWSEPRATYVFLCCNLALVPASLWWYASTLRVPWRERLLLLACASLFISAQECVRGGNLDGVMFALLIAAFSMRRRPWGALSLAASIVTKLYSVILIPVALRKRQWRFAALAMAACFVFLLPFHGLWLPALHALAGRNTRYDFSSISPVSLLYSITGEYSLEGKAIWLVVWAISFIGAVYCDRQKELSPYTLARYVPWMFALPCLVFSYVGVLALAVLASLVAIAGRRPLLRAEYYSFTGFLLLGIHAEHAANPMNLLYFAYHYAALIQACGVLLMMIGSCLSPCEAEVA